MYQIIKCENVDDVLDIITPLFDKLHDEYNITIIGTDFERIKNTFQRISNQDDDIAFYYLRATELVSLLKILDEIKALNQWKK